jgi:hypothetical protein
MRIATDENSTETLEPQVSPDGRPCGRVQHAAGAVLRWFGQVVDVLEQHPVVVVLVFTGVYFWATFAIAHYKQLWNDEFFTYYLSSAGFKGAWQALLTGADQHPPTFYWLIHSFTKVHGFGHVTFRLPSILAFWSMCLLLFWVVSRRTSNLMGYAAMLFPTTSNLFFYSVESRGYALLMMFSALAFVAWLAASSGVRRRLTIPLLGVALVGAFCSHYYAILVMIPLGMGELTRLIRDRRADWAVWAACASPLIAILLFLPVLKAAGSYSQHFWAKPSVEVLAACYQLISGAMEFFACVTLAYVWCSAMRRIGSAKPKARQINASPHEIVAVVGFALIPVFGFVLANTVTHGFWPRYAATCVIGITLVCAVAAHVVSHGSRSFAAALVLLLLCFSAKRAHGLLRQGQGEAADTLANYHSMLALADPNEPIVITELDLFHKLWFYGPPEVRARIALVADRDMAMKFVGSDTVDRGLLELKPWFKENVQTFHEFTAHTPHFLVYSFVGEWTWLPQGLIDEHLHVDLVTQRGNKLALQVTH